MTMMMRLSHKVRLALAFENDDMTDFDVYDDETFSSGAPCFDGI